MIRKFVHKIIFVNRQQSISKDIITHSVIGVVYVQERFRHMQRTLCSKPIRAIELAMHIGYVICYL